MEVGKYYKSNQAKVAALKDNDWKVALVKCKEHIKWRLSQKTLSGAHSSSNLGADPVEHYLGISYEKIITGEWEWKDGYTLVEQMIRIINSYISKTIENAKAPKSESFKIIYTDDEEQFYSIAAPPDYRVNYDSEEAKIRGIESAVAGDEQLEFLIEALKEGKKRAEIADLLDLGVRQFDKLKEKLIRRVKSQHTSTK